MSLRECCPTRTPEELFELVGLRASGATLDPKRSLYAVVTPENAKNDPGALAAQVGLAS